MNARLYDPKIGRFFSPDNFITDPENPQNYNRYSYALNNPLKYTDPSGNSHMRPIEEEFMGEPSRLDMPEGYNADVYGLCDPNRMGSPADILDRLFGPISTNFGGGGGKGAGGSPPKDPEKEEEKKEEEKDPEKKEESKEKEVNIPENNFKKLVQEDGIGCLFSVVAGILNGFGYNVTEKGLKDAYTKKFGDSWKTSGAGGNLYDMSNLLDGATDGKYGLGPIKTSEMTSYVDKGVPQIARMFVEHDADTYAHYVAITGYKIDVAGNISFRYWDPSPKAGFNYASLEKFDMLTSVLGEKSYSFIVGGSKK